MPTDRETVPARAAAVARLIAFVAFWSAVVALTLSSHDYVPRAQAYVRASTVPLGIAGLAMVLDRFAFERLTLKTVTLPAIFALPAIQLAYVLGRGSMVAVAFAAAFAIGLLLKGDVAQGRNRPVAVVVLLTILSSEFTFHYVDFLLHRIGMIPASALVLISRSIAASLVLAGSCGMARVAQWWASRLGDDDLAALAMVGVAYVQVAYFYVDWFTDPRLRFVQVTTVVVVATGVVALSKAGAPSAIRLGSLTAVGLLGLVCLQFANFYAESFRDFQSRGSTALIQYVGRPVARDRAAVVRSWVRCVRCTTASAWFRTSRSPGIKRGPLASSSPASSGAIGTRSSLE